MPAKTVLVNRAPVLTLWAAIVAERLGYNRATALTLGRAVAGLDAQTKGRRLGIFPGAIPSAAAAKAKRRPKPPKTVELLGRAVRVARTPDGLRARVKDRPESPASVERYLEEKFGEALPQVKAAMRALAKAHPPKRLEEIAFSLYEKFRPEIPKGAKGWGAKGRLDLNLIRALAREDLMKQCVEIRSYNLKPGVRENFHRLVLERAGPMLKRWKVDVVDYGPSPHDADSYYLIRAYPSLEAREQSQGAFYGSAEWRDGPRDSILALIESYATIVLMLDDLLVQGLRRAPA